MSKYLRFVLTTNKQGFTLRQDIFLTEQKGATYVPQRAIFQLEIRPTRHKQRRNVACKRKQLPTRGVEGLGGQGLNLIILLHLCFFKRLAQSIQWSQAPKSSIRFSPGRSPVFLSQCVQSDFLGVRRDIYACQKRLGTTVPQLDNSTPITLISMFQKVHKTRPSYSKPF